MPGWVITAQFMAAAVFLTVALNHFAIWSRGDRFREHLLFAAASVAAAGSSLSVCAVYAATSVASITLAFKLDILFAALWLTALTWFVAFYSRAAGGRRWWAVALSALFGVVIVVNFMTPGGAVFATITGIRETHLWGERLAFPVGPVGSWRIVGDLGLLGLLVFVIDASVTLWRYQGDRRRALFLGGSIVVFLVVAGGYGVLVEHGVLEPPYLDAYGFLAVVLVMNHNLAGEVVQAARLARQVEAGERRWQTFLNNVHLAMVGLDREGCIEYVNPYAVALFGYVEAEMLGRLWFDLVVPGPERPRRWRQFKRFLDAEHPSDYENQVITKTGECLQINWSRVPLRDPDGHVSGILAVGEDVTARRRAELEVRRQRDELAHVNRITAMGELTASLAHELNQPLAAILNNAQAARRFMASDGIDLDEVRAILDDIIADDQRAAEIIRRLRALARKTPAELAPLQLADVVRDVVSLLRGDAMLRQVRVSVATAPHLPLVLGSSVQLQQVVLNLLLNAFDAMRDCPADRREALVRVEPDGTRGVTVTVIDRGPGIDSGLLDTVFEPFYTTKGNGMGMGLSICRSIIDAHGGRLWAENNQDQGACFVFSLPVSEADAAA